MPETRSSRKRRPVRLSTCDFLSDASDIGNNGPSRQKDAQSTSDDSIEEHIGKIQTGAQKLKREIEALRRKNDSLKDELEAAKEASVLQNSRRRKRQNTGSDDDTNLAEIRIRDLEKAVKDLKLENRRQRRRIEKLKSKQLEEEVKDLQLSPTDEGNSGDGQDIDPEFRMRKLLRKFSDLMMATTISEDTRQECLICFEKLVLKKCSALDCGHLVCHECLPGISKGADETVRCPKCQRPSSRDRLELVHWTEEGRWDALLDVAQAWDAFDVRGEQETSEEEAEENFFTNENGTSDCTSETGHETNQTAEDTTSESAVVVTDNDDSRPFTPPPAPKAFSESPTKEKRKRLEQLAEGREQKRRK